MKKHSILKSIIVLLIVVSMSFSTSSIVCAEDNPSQDPVGNPTETDPNPSDPDPIPDPDPVPTPDPVPDPVPTPNPDPAPTPEPVPTQPDTPSRTPTQKSGNTNLKDLGIRPNDFSGFTPWTTSYDVTVPEDVEQVEVYASAQDAKASVTGTGMKSLEKGKNTLDVVVTAENGTTKTYHINVTREGVEEENTENVQQQYSGDGLASLTVENLELSPKFDTTIYEYSVKYIGKETKLKIETEATDPYYTVEVTGNEDLKEGENTITILVSDPDGNNVATYQVIINKSLVDEEKLAREQEELKRQEEQKKLYIIGGTAIAVCIMVAIIVFFVVRNRRNRMMWGEEDYEEYDDYDEEYDDYDENYEEEPEEIGYSPEEAREKFLNDYNSPEDEFYDEEEMDDEPLRRRHRGKRFK